MMQHAMNYDSLAACALLFGLACFMLGRLVERRKQQKRAAKIHRINERYRPAMDR